MYCCRFHDGIGPRCLNDVYFYDYYGEDDYGYLVYGWSDYIISACFTDWWFIEGKWVSERIYSMPFQRKGHSVQQYIKFHMQ